MRGGVGEERVCLHNVEEHRRRRELSEEHRFDMEHAMHIELRSRNTLTKYNRVYFNALEGKVQERGRQGLLRVVIGPHASSLCKSTRLMRVCACMFVWTLCRDGCSSTVARGRFFFFALVEVHRRRRVCVCLGEEVLFFIVPFLFSCADCSCSPSNELNRSLDGVSCTPLVFPLNVLPFLFFDLRTVVLFRK